MIRNATVDDLPALLAIEDLCWDVALRASSATILNRITANPGGQHIYEDQGEILGILYTHRISCRLDEMIDKGFLNQASLHDHNGDTIQLLAINVPNGKSCTTIYLQTTYKRSRKLTYHYFNYK
jgi:rhizoxin biosynthesis, polyketide synthase / nonribosomal peptide synthetase RhiA